MAKNKVIQWNGDVITKPGIYADINLDIYHSSELFGGVPSISSSGLREIFNRSPAHYWVSSPYNPDRAEDEEEKKQFVLGRALHHLVGAQRGFRELFVVRPEKLPDIGERTPKPWNGNRTACREWLKDQKLAGRAVLTPDDVVTLEGMALSLGRHPLVTSLSGQIEHSYFWRDKETGIWLKWRPDSTPNDSADFVDLKTTTDVRFYKLMKTVADFGYNQQGALGRWACAELLGAKMNSFSLFFVEKKKPYSTSLVQMKDADLDLGERMNRLALRSFWKCWKSGEWPGPADDTPVGYVEIPDRTRDDIKARLNAEGV